MKRSSSSSPALKAIEKYVVGGGSAGGATIQRLRREGPTETTITRTANGLQQRR
jgi:cation diffusion facilitator CzcD-associated flavoprotein CzcO